MLSDDVYRARSAAAIAELEAWLQSLRPFAHVWFAPDSVSWRVVATPTAERACPFELVVRQDQRFDIAVAGEHHEEQPVERLDLFLPLLRAITAGDVLLRTSRTAATGALIEVETIVGRDGAAPLPWRRKRVEGKSGRLTTPGDAIASERHFAPYARGA